MKVRREKLRDSHMSSPGRVQLALRGILRFQYKREKNKDGKEKSGEFEKNFKKKKFPQKREKERKNESPLTEGDRGSGTAVLVRFCRLARN